MSYINYCCHDDHVSSLTKEEIKNPVSVLENIYKRRPPVSFKEDICEFFWSIFRSQLWKKKGGAHLYSICTDLLQLIDALWLINSYNLNPDTSANDNRHTQKSKCAASILFSTDQAIKLKKKTVKKIG